MSWLDIFIFKNASKFQMSPITQENSLLCNRTHPCGANVLITSCFVLVPSPGQLFSKWKHQPKIHFWRKFCKVIQMFLSIQKVGDSCSIHEQVLRYWLEKRLCFIPCDSHMEINLELNTIVQTVDGINESLFIFSTGINENYCSDETSKCSFKRKRQFIVLSQIH